jgi:hypothetical protein
MVNDQGLKPAGWARERFASLFAAFDEMKFSDASLLLFQNPELLVVGEDCRATSPLPFEDRLVMPKSRRKVTLGVLSKPKVLSSRLWTGYYGQMQETGVVVADGDIFAFLLVTRMAGLYRNGNETGEIVGSLRSGLW